MLLLTSQSLLRRAHHMIETNRAFRTGAITATAAAVGLAAGRSRTVRKIPAVGLAAGGFALSFLGLTGIGDGLASSGATILGYRYGATGRFTRRRSAPVAVTPPGPVGPVAAGQGQRRRRG